MDSYFQEGVKLKGVLHSKGVLHVGGEFEGEIFSTDHLVIGKGGFVKGNIKTYDITNLGTIQGDVEAENKVNLKENSTLTGNIKTHQLVVDEGSNFEGQCHMTKAKPEPRTSHKPKKKEPVEKLTPISEASPVSVEDIIPEPVSSPLAPGESEKKSTFAFITKLPKSGKFAIGIIAVLAVSIWTVMQYSGPEPNSVSDFLNKGTVYLGEKKFSDAEGEFLKALKISRNNPHVYAGLGEVYLQKKEWNQALTQFQRSLDLQPTENNYRIKLAKVYSGKGQFKEAADIYHSVIKNDQQNSRAFYELGALKLSEGVRDEGIAALRVASRIDPEFYRPHRLLSEMYLKENKLAEAIHEMKQAVRIQKDEPELHLVLAELFIKNNQKEEAVEEFERVVELFPENLKARTKVAHWYLEKGDYVKSLDSYQAAEKLDPQNPAIQTQLGKIYLTSNDKEKAELALRKAVKLDDQNGEGFYLLGKLLSRDNKRDEAKTALETAVELDPKLGGAHYELGQILMETGQVSPAAQSFERAYKAVPENLQYILALGHAQTANKNANRAVEVLLTAAKMKPNNGRVSQELCEAYKKKGFYRVSITHCEKAYNILPGSYPVMNRLAWLYAKKKTKLKKAMRLSRKVVQANPQNPKYLDTLAEIYYVRGKKNQAIDTIQKALSLDADNRLYKQQLWRFKHIKNTPPKVKTEAAPPAETTESADAETGAEETTDSSDLEVVVTPFDTFGTPPEESTPETSNVPLAAEEL